MAPMSTRPPDDDDLRRGNVDPRTLTDAGLVAELIIEVRSLARSVATFAESLATNDRRIGELEDLRRRNRTLGYVIAAALALLTVAIAAAVALGAVAFDRLADVADGNAANGRVLVECTTPSPPAGEALDDADSVHECFERGQQSQAAAVAAIGEDMARAAACARRHDTEELILDCVRAARAAASTTTTTTQGGDR